MTIKNVIFDMGNVLVRINPPSTPEAFVSLGTGKEAVNAAFEHKELFIEYHSGFIDTPTFRRILKEELNLPHITDEQFDKAWLASVTEPTYLTEDFKHRLREIEGYKHHRLNTFLLSNNNEVHYLYTTKYFSELLNRAISADRQYYSHQIGLMKPELEVYNFVLDKNNLKSDECIFIDDVLENVEAAKAVGMHALQLTRDDPIENILIAINDINAYKTLSNSSLALFNEPPKNSDKQQELQLIQNSR
ncbi:MAG: HAD family phosphatase [Gammaproteobacteria bacterium]|nr:HAD family phosphatase [Gammaproteobacteria bacterium]